MVNQKQGKTYEPTPVYNRGLIRSTLKHRIAAKYGQHKVNKLMHEAFENIKGGIE